MNRPILTVLIPTRNRVKQLSETLESFSNILKNSKHASDIEIAVVDNFSKDDVKEVVDLALEKCKNSVNIKYYKHKKSRSSAEESMSHAVRFCAGEYIWCFGDDDIPKDNCFDTIIPVIKKNLFRFILLNMDLRIEGEEIIDYIKSTSRVVKFKKGRDLFYDFGLVSATTTLSCLLFKKEDFDIDVFKKYSKVSKIYSHSFSFCEMFIDKPCAFIGEKVLTYNANSAEDELKRISELSDSCAYYSFTAGLYSLIYKLSSSVKISVDEILSFNEIEFQKDNNAIAHMDLKYFIYYIIIDQIEDLINNYSSYKDSAIIDFCNFLDLVLENDNIIPFHLKDYIYLASSVFINVKVKEKFQIEGLKHGIKLWRTNLSTKSEYHKKYKVHQYDKEPCVIFHDSGPNIRMLSGEGCDYIFNKNKKSSNLEQKGKLLTILIPSYNRQKSLESKLKFLSHWGSFFKDQIEIVVVLNKCTDNSLNIVKDFNEKFEFIRYHYRDIFLNTAEENICKSIQFCKGDYIWTLGDDDLVSPHVFVLLNYLVAKYKSIPAFLFNHSITDIDSQEVCKNSYLFDKVQNVPVEASLSSFPYKDLVQNHGLTTAMAFISRYVINKKYLIKPGFLELIKISPIYSHVFFFLKIFHKKRVVWVDYPLVARFDSKIEKRVDDLSTELDVNPYHMWSGGVLKLLVHLQREIPIESDFLFKIKEEVPSNHFMMYKENIQSLIRQYNLYLKNIKNKSLAKYLLSDLMLLRYFSSCHHGSIKNKSEYICDRILDIYNFINIKLESGGMTNSDIYQAQTALNSVSDLNLSDEEFICTDQSAPTPPPPPPPPPPPELNIDESKIPVSQIFIDKNSKSLSQRVILKMESAILSIVCKVLPIKRSEHKSIRSMNRYIGRTLSVFLVSGYNRKSLRKYFSNIHHEK